MIRVEHIDHDNDCLLAVNAARVSMGKHHTAFDADERSGSDTRLLRYLARENHWTPYAHAQLTFRRESSLQDALTWMVNRTPGCETVIESMNEWAVLIDRGSLWFWMNPKNRALLRGDQQVYVEAMIAKDFPHCAAAGGIRMPPAVPVRSGIAYVNNLLTDTWVARDPWARTKLPTLTFRVTAPFPIRTQAFKHKYGFVENEISARYVSEPLGLHIPDTWRAAPESVKQGSGEPVDPAAQLQAATLYSDVAQHAEEARKALLALGICAEQVRFINLQGTLTQWYWTASLDALVRMIRQRSDSHAQAEVRQIAEQILPVVRERFPKTLVALAGL